MIKDSGAKYAVLTSKHHEGFTLWKTNSSWNWNSVDIGPHRDILRLYVDAIRKEGLKVGIYFSLFEWFHPLFELDRSNNFNTKYYVKEISNKQLYELVNIYQPDYLWFDGDGVTDSVYWETKQFLAWLYNESPVKDTVIVNDRMGTDATCKHGDVRTCFDRYHPSFLPSYKFENAFTLDKKSWGYRREMQLEDVLTFKEILSEFIFTISIGGNVLINAGPTKEGTFDILFQEKFHQIGQWLKIYGESVYSTKACPYQNQQKLRFTCKGNIIYVFFLEWPINNTIEINDLQQNSLDPTVKLIGVPKSLIFQFKNGVLSAILDVFHNELPNHDGWVLKLTGFSMTKMSDNTI